MSLDFILSLPEEQFDLLGKYWPFEALGKPDEEYVVTGGACTMSYALGGQLIPGESPYVLNQVRSLPKLSIMAVKGLEISLPLLEATIAELLGRCEKSERGVERWEVRADQVEIGDSKWSEMVMQSSRAVATSMQFQSIKFDIEMANLVVYGPGGRRERSRDDAIGDRDMIKVIVQLPSAATGGDFVVYDDEDSEKQHRIHFESGADAPPRLSALIADAEYAVEEVRGGYRAMLEYVMRLPLEIEPVGPKRATPFYLKLLCRGMEELNEEKGTFALLLVEQYEEYHAFNGKGTSRLYGYDSDRFTMLEKANALLPKEKQFKFYITEFDQSTELCRDVCVDDTPQLRSRGFAPVSARGHNGVIATPWRVTGIAESIKWFSAGGKRLRNCNFESCSLTKWFEKLKFLNLTNESLRAIWERKMTRSGLVDEQTIAYQGFAIVGWPLAYDLENMSNFIGDKHALSTLLETNHALDVPKLHEFMELASGNEIDEEDEDDEDSDNCGSYMYSTQYMTFCKMLCKEIAAVGDVKLLKMFFTKFFQPLKKKEEFVPVLQALISAFAWRDLREIIVDAINQMSPFDAVVLSLALTHSCKESENVYAVAMELAAEKALLVQPDANIASRAGWLWERAASCRAPAVFSSISKLLKRLDGSSLCRVVDTLSSSVNANSAEEQRNAFAAIVSTRIGWLDAEIARQDIPFTWEMPDAVFPANPDVEAFLRGPEPTFLVRGFPAINAARIFINEHTQSPFERYPTCSYTMNTRGRGKNSAVVIIKTREQYERHRGEVIRLKHERTRLLETLSTLGASDNVVIGQKRPRPD